MQMLRRWKRTKAFVGEDSLAWLTESACGCVLNQAAGVEGGRTWPVTFLLELTKCDLFAEVHQKPHPHKTEGAPGQ